MQTIELKKQKGKKHLKKVTCGFNRMQPALAVEYVTTEPSSTAKNQL